jgi:chorismate mutase
MQANYTLSRNPLSLERIRSILTRLEDTIIFSLIERAQFAHNPKIYERGVFKELKALEFNGSWLEWFLKETEIFHGAPPPPHLLPSQLITLSGILAKARRYTRPVTHPFVTASLV